MTRDTPRAPLLLWRSSNDSRPAADEGRPSLLFVHGLGHGNSTGRLRTALLDWLPKATA